MASHARGRVDWVDYAKGFCICFVVMMHSTLGVGDATGQEGWLHPVVAFARPFRMPDFFMISGLFLSLVIDRDWRTYLDRKVVHFFYFYILWMTIQFVFKAPGMAAEHGSSYVVHQYFLALIEPFGTLWFIYLLPIMFVVVKATLRVPVIVIWLTAAALEVWHIHTGWTVIDEFAARFVYFYTGYIMARPIFRFAASAQTKPLVAAVALLCWGITNYWFVFNGYAQMAYISLALGLAGAAAVVTLSALLARIHWLEFLRYCGENSIVVYLAFFLPMAMSRTALLKTHIVTDVGTISAIVTLCGIVGSLSIFWAVRHTPAKFLFVRPKMFWLTEKKQPALQPAE